MYAHFPWHIETLTKELDQTESRSRVCYIDHLITLGEEEKFLLDDFNIHGILLKEVACG